MQSDQQDHLRQIISQNQKEITRSKRQKLRQSVKAICFNKKNHQCKKPQISYAQVAQISMTNSVQPLSPPRNRKRRNTTCFQSCSFMNSLKDLMVNINFEDSFQIQEPIGAGSHSIVYKCIDLISNEVLAVKVQKKGDEEMIERIKDHYRILKSLRHPGIINGKYLHINKKRSTTHLVLQYCKYPQLKCFITTRYKSGKGISEFEAAQILQTLLEIVIYLHGKGCCHRDLKPQNILYDEVSGEVKIIDFEIAKMPKYQHQKLQMLTDTGTLLYRAPESFSGDLYNQKVDVWAIGIIAYELLTGRVPFKSLLKLDVIKIICNCQPTLQPLDITPSAKIFIKKLLQKDPLARPSSQQAINLPFIMRQQLTSCSSRSSKSPRVSKNQEEDLSSSRKEQKEWKGSKGYYDENSKFSFLGTIHEDIGIRVYQSQIEEDQQDYQ